MSPRGHYRVFVFTPLPSHAHSPCASDTNPCTPEILSRRLTTIHMEGTSAMAPSSGDVLRCVPHVVPCVRGPTADTFCGRAQARVRSGGWVLGVRGSLWDLCEGWQHARGMGHAVVEVRSVFGCTYIVNWPKMAHAGHARARAGAPSTPERAPPPQRGPPPQRRPAAAARQQNAAAYK